MTSGNHEVTVESPFDLHWLAAAGEVPPTFIMDFSRSEGTHIPQSRSIAQHIMERLIKPAEATILAVDGTFDEDGFTQTRGCDKALQVVSLGDQARDTAAAICIHQAMLDEAKKESRKVWNIVGHSH